MYRGLTRHKDQIFPGAHPPIIDEDLWDQVQAKLQAASAKRRGTSQDQGSTAPLLGKFRYETGDRLTPTHTSKKGRRIRYYVSKGLVSGKPRPDAWRLPAKQFEGAVAGVVAEHLAQHAQLRSVLKDGSGNAMETASQRAEALAQRIKRSGIQAVAQCIANGAIAKDIISIHLDASTVAACLDLQQTNLNAALLVIKTKFTCRRRGQETKIIAGEAKPQPDQTLVKALRNAHAWAEALKSGTPIKEIARANKCSDSYARRVIPLATLSPKLQSAILDGRLPDHITLESFIRVNIPLEWADQEERFSAAI